MRRAPGTLLTPWPRLSRSSSWPPARALACFRILRRFFIGLPVSRSWSGLPMPRGRPVRSVWLRWSGPVMAWRRGFRTGIEVAEQREGEGTGAAVLAARDAVGSGPVLVLSGDHPADHARAARGAARRARAGGGQRDPAHHRPARPRGLRANRARLVGSRGPNRRDQVHRRRLPGGAGRGRDQPRHLRLRRADPLRGPRQGRARQGRALPDRRVPIHPRRRRDNRRTHDRRRGRRTRRERPRGPDGGRGGRPAPDHRGPRQAGCHVPGSRAPSGWRQA